ncbi:NAD(P)-binding protein [Wolfiporia cocos MD-104 SS10]|uniref:NAD(P)-binding protein n=1 Tax=Wolfiporia cocos (strain MD-104) TaxID=742152 RepID=A0A2H3JLE8_WOLCO|nr:NAD(P)-binding protein [Wolfiporia cocos MD-104 SS10]
MSSAFARRGICVASFLVGIRRSHCTVVGRAVVSPSQACYTQTRFSSSSGHPRGPYAAVHAEKGVAAALNATSLSVVKPILLEQEFSLTDRVALVSGANRGLGLEMALALVEAGARAVYCNDLSETPGGEFKAVKQYVDRMEGKGRIEYISADVRDQDAMWRIGETIGDREGRMDVCVAAAGVLKPDHDCLDYPAETFREVIDINVNGVFFTAQAAGRQMARFGNGGSIILIASMSGSITNIGQRWVSYNTSKSAVIQMARSLGCELAPQRIRVNSLSPGYIYTKLTGLFLDSQPGLLEKWSSQNPTGRLGRPDELRGVVTWLASDASTYCTGSDIIVDGGHRAW